MMSLPFLAAKLPLGSSIAVNYNEQSKIRQVTISKSSHGEFQEMDLKIIWNKILLLFYAIF